MSREPRDSASTESMPPRPSREPRFLPGTVIAGRYRIVALAGRGGMGEVYRADDLKLGQAVALKFLPSDLERDRDLLQRLLGEVRIARRVSHPNACRVHDLVEFEGHHFISMEYVDGEDLAALLRRIGRLPQEKALDLARQIAAGLAAAHVQGIVHRDLKPANIMLDGRGRARITDFGLAAAVEAVRGEEARSGTPAYMAPEQVAGGPVTPSTDVYALGLVLFEMCTGRRAFADSAGPAGESHADELPPRPSSVVAGLGPALDAAILKCIERDPSKRPASAMALIALLPGGDPLDAAVRAGETPSPEMVASAGEEGALSPAKAWGLFGLALIAAAAGISIASRVTGLDAVPMPRGPDALRERAQDIVRQLGGDASPRAVDWWIDLDDGYAEWSRAQAHAPSLADVHPPAVRFNYRQSTEPLMSNIMPRPTRLDPAPSWSGDAYVAVDPAGALLQFSRIDRQLAPSDSGRAAPLDWGPLLALAGATTESLHAVVPLWTPDVPCDARAAWVVDRGAAPVRLEAAGWKGKPVWFSTIAPWQRAERDAPMTPGSYPGFAAFVTVILVTLGAFAALARHNLRQGRSDTRGAVAVGVAVFLFFGLGTTLYYRFSLQPLHVWRWMLHQPYFPAMMAWLYYLSIEPFLRRRWPHRLIAWTRLLSGRPADPLVGREMLFGLVAGAGIALANCIPTLVERRHDVEVLIGSLPLGRAADFWGSTIGTLGEGLMKGLGSFAFLLLLRVIFRRDGVAWLGLGLLWMLINLPSWNVSAIQWISIAAAAACFVLAVRVGLVAAVVATWTASLLLSCTPLTLDLSRWYAWRAAAIAVLLFALAVWGFRAVMGRRRIISAAMFET